MELKDFFAEHPKTALAFSGGVDSAYLLYAGLDCGADIRAYYVKSPFQPDFEYRDAMELAKSLKTKPVVIELDVLGCQEIRENPPERCYFCKKRIMSAIKERADAEGYSLIIDGTNASDQVDERPGMKALGEEGILSPLRLCGLEKSRIRSLSKQAGLFTWDKPAYACLATRIPAGEEITREKLEKIEKSEDALAEMGYWDFRVRMRGQAALLQFTHRQHSRAKGELEEIKRLLRPYFEQVELDEKERENSQ